MQKSNIVNIANILYRVGDTLQGSGINVDDGPRKYHPVETVFPYNDIENQEPIVFDNTVTVDILFIFPQQNSPQFIELIQNQMKLSRLFTYELFEKWIKIGTLEYKLTYAYCGERINVIYRQPGEICSIYNILYTTEFT